MIWLIGCNGMLGTEVASKLSERKIDFVGTGHEVDITEISALSDFAEGKNIDFIINCTGYTNVDKAESEPDLAKKINEIGTENIARLANQIHATLIHISTDYVFDGTATVPYTEDTPVSPVGVYALTKASSEIAVWKNLNEYYIFRTAWFYGFSGKNFVYTMLRMMNSHDSVKVVNDQKGSPTFAVDLAEVIIKIIEQASSNRPLPYGIYHCTDSGEATWYDFACEIKKQAAELGLLKNKNCRVIPCTTEE
nr:dTDP-4-dehydrorhamnose reductase [Treponema sp.]